MKSIPCCRAAHVWSYVNFLRSTGAPVDTAMRRAGVPTLVDETDDLVLPVIPYLDVFTLEGRELGLDQLAIRSLKSFSIGDLSAPILNELGQAPTLRLGLATFCKMISLEDNRSTFWISDRGDRTRICCRTDLPCSSDGSRLNSWSQNLVLLAIIRAFAGEDYQPLEIGFGDGLTVDEGIKARFPKTRFATGSRITWIEVPRAVLALPPGFKTVRGRKDTASNGELNDLVTCSKSIIKSYLADRRPRIDVIARAAGVSVRSLQRALKEAGTTYSDLTETARFELASALLDDRDNKVIDVALAVGFDDPSNFARFFRRVSGLSPREYCASDLIADNLTRCSQQGANALRAHGTTSPATPAG